MDDLKHLERMAADSKVAMESADQSLSKREECVLSLQAQIRAMEGTENLEIVPESPVKPVYDSYGRPKSDLDKFRESVHGLDLSFDENKRTETSSPGTGSYHGDSSGVVADCESDNLSDNEVQLTNPQKLVAKNESERLKGQFPDSGIDRPNKGLPPELKSSGNLSFEEKAKQFSQFTFQKLFDDNRVLQVVLSPLKQKTIVKHTKSSILRLKNSPAKDPTRGRECMKNKLIQKSIPIDKIAVKDKRKCVDIDENSPLNTSKRRKMASTAEDRKAKPKRISTSRFGQKYNLRSRH